MLRSEIILQWVKGSAVLDVGCAGHVPEPGSPYWVHGRLRERFPTVVGIDFNENNIGMLKGLGYESLYVASAEDFSLPQKFDTIVAGELIEHLSNPGLFLKRCKEHLAPEGRVVLTTPHPFSLLSILYAMFKYPKTCQNPEHTCWFCPQTLRELGERHGFRVMHWDLIESYRPDNPSSRYRLFVRFISILRPIIPKLLRNNTILFILELDEGEKSFSS